jgi:hypothetical protein
MRFLTILSVLLGVAIAAPPHRVPLEKRAELIKRSSPRAARRSLPVLNKRANTTVISPKIVIVNLFLYEQDVFWADTDFNVLANNITVPGMSPIYPDVHW